MRQKMGMNKPLNFQIMTRDAQENSLFYPQKCPLTNQNLHEKLAECFDEPAIGNGGHVV